MQYHIHTAGGFIIISVGIDVAKDKHDCFIISSDDEVLKDVFTIPNRQSSFRSMLQRIRECSSPQDKIKVGLEATGHYSYNLLGFLIDNGLLTYVLNPLHTNLYRKSLSLRKTKTDRGDARTIAAMLLSDVMDQTGHTKSYTYDTNENIATETVENGGTIINTCDNSNRIITSRDESGPITTFTYDAAGLPD